MNRLTKPSTAKAVIGLGMWEAIGYAVGGLLIVACYAVFIGIYVLAARMRGMPVRRSVTIIGSALVLTVPIWAALTWAITTALDTDAWLWPVGFASAAVSQLLLWRLLGTTGPGGTSGSGMGEGPSAPMPSGASPETRATGASNDGPLLVVESLEGSSDESVVMSAR